MNEKQNYRLWVLKLESINVLFIICQMSARVTESLSLHRFQVVRWLSGRRCAVKWDKKCLWNAMTNWTWNKVDERCTPSERRFLFVRRWFELEDFYRTDLAKWSNEKKAFYPCSEINYKHKNDLLKNTLSDFRTFILVQLNSKYSITINSSSFIAPIHCQGPTRAQGLFNFISHDLLRAIEIKIHCHRTRLIVNSILL